MKLTGDRNQCPTCGEHFNRTSGFDRHRAGKIGAAPARRCLTVREMEAAGFTKSGAGFWLAPMTEKQRARQEYRFQPIGRRETGVFKYRIGDRVPASEECAFRASL
jgi:hypothetical protein